MGGGPIPPWLQVQSPGCRGTRLGTEPARMEGRGGRSRSCFLVRSSHLGILWRSRRTHEVRLWICTKTFTVPPRKREILHTPPPKWWNWSCPISNQAVSSSLIWVYKQLHTSPPHLSHSFSSQPSVPLDGFPRSNFWIWMRSSKMRSQPPRSPARSCRPNRSVTTDVASSNIPLHYLAGLSWASQTTLHYSQHAVQSGLLTPGGSWITRDHSGQESL